MRGLDSLLAERHTLSLGVAEAINAHEREHAFDQVIIGYLLKIANELASGRPARRRQSPHLDTDAITRA